MLRDMYTWRLQNVVLSKSFKLLWPMERKVMRSSATSGDTPFLENMCIIGDAWDWAVRWLLGASFVVCAWMFAAYHV